MVAVLIDALLLVYEDAADVGIRWAGEEERDLPGRVLGGIVREDAELLV